MELNPQFVERSTLSSVTELPAATTYKVVSAPHQYTEWKDVILAAYDVLTWRYKYNPHMIFAMVTFIFMIHSYFHISLISTVAMVTLEIALVEFCLKKGRRRKLFKTWTTDHQQRYERACENFDQVNASLTATKAFLSDMKMNSPKLYALVVFGGLTKIAYIGSVMNNTVLLYLIVLLICLSPGLMHRGILQKHFGKFFKELKMVLDSKVLKPNAD